MGCPELRFCVGRYLAEFRLDLYLLRVIFTVGRVGGIIDRGVSGSAMASRGRQSYLQQYPGLPRGDRESYHACNLAVGLR